MKQVTVKGMVHAYNFETAWGANGQLLLVPFVKILQLLLMIHLVVKNTFLFYVTLTFF
jgi:hypothetical protein